MPEPGFVQTLPELLLLVRRDGSLLEAAGGRGVLPLVALGSWEADEFRPLWPTHVSELIAQLARRAIGERGAVDGYFELHGNPFEIRAMAMGRDRCVCVIRSATVVNADRRNSPVPVAPEMDRRGFLRRLKEVLSEARLREKLLAVAVIQIDDVTDVVVATDLLQLAHPGRKGHRPHVCARRDDRGHQLLAQGADAWRSGRGDPRRNRRCRHSAFTHRGGDH